MPALGFSRLMGKDITDGLTVNLAVKANAAAVEVSVVYLNLASSRPS